MFEELLNGTQLRLVTGDVSEMEGRSSLDTAFPQLDGVGILG